MKVRSIAILLTILIVGTANAVPWLPGSVSSNASIAPQPIYQPHPVRDDADEDTVFYSYGFENGLNGWTTKDLTFAGDKWHISETHAFSGRSWWSGDEELNGYDNHWLQYLDSPAMDLRGRQNVRLKFMAYWSMERSVAGDTAIPDPYDGWDGCNVWLSTDNGANWQVIRPESPRYNRQSLYCFGFEWGMGADIPGWVSSSDSANWPGGRWVEADFALQNVNANQVKIRWAFASDPGWHTGEAGDENRSAWGLLVDSIRVTSGNDVVWSNNGEEQGGMTVSSAEGFGDYWQITDDDAHDGNSSIRCTVHPKLSNALISPPLEIQPGWSTWFEFWVRCDMSNPFSLPDSQYIVDLYHIQYSTDQLTWTEMLADWARPDLIWADDFHFFGPDSFYRNFQSNIDKDTWVKRLNLSRFAGETVYLRWVAYTDTNMAEDQGTGLYIDDFRLVGEQKMEHDVGVAWLDINYPNTVGQLTSCGLGIKNYGINDEGQVIKWSRFEERPRAPIQPSAGLDADAELSYTFNIPAAQITYADSVRIMAYTVTRDDTTRGNDTTRAYVVVYPQGIWKLGYDSRHFSAPNNFALNNGPAVKFTPLTDGVQGAYAIKAIKVKWNNAQNENVTTHMSIFRAAAGGLGARLYEADVVVRPEDCIPNEQIIDLSEVNALQRLQGDFWVYFNIAREDFWPQIMGEPETNGRGHYFVSNGAGIDTVDMEYQMHAILMPGGNSPTNTLLAGRTILAFDTVAAGLTKTRRIALYNGGVNVVTVSSAAVDDQSFHVEAFDAKTLEIGDMMTVYVTYTAQNTDPKVGHLTFESSDPTSPVVIMTVNGGNAAVGDEPLSPYKFELGKAYPNPFNATTVIPFSVEADVHVKVAVYDLAGRMVAELVNGKVKAGSHTIRYSADELATGFYMLRMEAGSFTAVEKLLLVK